MSINKCVRALIDPFDPDAKGCALPSGSCTGSYRTSAVIRCDGKFATDGTAMITVNPSVANDMNCLWISNGGGNNQKNVLQTCNDYTSINATATSTGLTFTNVEQGGTNAYAATALPYTSSNILGTSQYTWSEPDVRARIVTAGVKLTFSGSTLQDGGTVYSLIEPTHGNLAGATALDIASRYTSTKIQRIALRGTVSMNLFPVTRAQQEFSNAFDEISASTTYGIGKILNTGLTTSVDQYNGIVVTDLGTCGGVATGGIATAPPATINNVQLLGRSCVSLLYPLSRRNASYQSIGQLYGAGNSLTFTAAGAITFTGFQPPQWMSGAAIVIDDVDNDPYFAGYIVWDITAGAWFLTNSNGMRYTGPASVSGAAYTIKYNVFDPPAFAFMVIDAGSAAAGQTFHVEYIVHVEYTGVAVQGRTLPIVPDEPALSVMHAVLDHAKETHGQSETTGLQHAIVESFGRYAESAAPSVIGTIANALVPGSGAAVAGVSKPLLHSIVNHARKRAKF